MVTGCLLFSMTVNSTIRIFQKCPEVTCPKVFSTSYTGVKNNMLHSRAASPRDLERADIMQKLLGLCIVFKMVPDWL